MPSPQKNKGNSFERDIAKFLSNLYNESFIKTPGSGAYIGGTNNAKKDMLHEGQIRSFKGDIVPGESFKKFNAECKFYKEFQWHQLYSGKCALLDKWISQLLEPSDEDDVNVIFMKFNRLGSFFVFEEKYLTEYEVMNYTSYHHIETGSTWIIVELNSFFEKNADQFKLHCSNLTTTRQKQ